MDQRIRGSLGGVVFDNKLYCFFTTEDGVLQYVTVDASTGATTEPTLIDSDVPLRGAVAAVMGDVIYVFTTGRVYRSSDGKFFSYDTAIQPSSVDRFLDAVTFYPPDAANQANRKIMLVFLDDQQMPYMTQYVPGTFDLTVKLPYSQDVVLKPLEFANLLLGTHFGDAEVPSIQLFGFADVYNELTDSTQFYRWQYNESSKTWSGPVSTGWIPTREESAFTAAAPWLETVDDPVDNKTMRLWHLPFRLYDSALYPSGSDWLVPQYNDTTYGWEGKPTPTADASNELRNLWTIVGMVLGPPPFAKNAVDDAAGPPPLSAVDYGTDKETSITTKHTTSSVLSVGSETKINGGLGEANFDFSFAHGWKHVHGTTHTTTVSQDFTFGPEDEVIDQQGTHGWAIFDAPILLTQRYKRYAYDYDPTKNQGTYLGQDMYATAVGPVAQQTALFDLKHPQNGSYPDLFEGLHTYPYSTEVPGWFQIKDWNKTGNDWTVVFGDGTSGTAVGNLTQGTKETVTYTQSTTNFNSRGNSNKIDLEAGASLDLFEGYETGITVGYKTKWETETEIETSVTEYVSATLDMPFIDPKSDEPDGYIANLQLQPYWLQAETDHAPWIPPGYSANLPWAITWNVFQYCGWGYVGPLPFRYCPETAPQPLSAGGRIRSGTWRARGWSPYREENGVAAQCRAWLDEEELQEPAMMADALGWSNGVADFGNDWVFLGHRRIGWLQKWGRFYPQTPRDRYEVEGYLAWLDEDGVQEPLAMTADEFDPHRGAAVFVNDREFRADRKKGRWVRTSDVWTYRSHGYASSDRFVLTLDFGGGTWSFQAQAMDLERFFPLGEARTRVELKLNRSYGFALWLEHELSSVWRHSECGTARDPYGVDAVAGAYDSLTDVGHLALRGHIPANDTSFGDVEILVNDTAVSFPLLRTEGFRDAMDHSGTVKYAADGLSFALDFGTGIWEAHIEDDLFRGDMAPAEGNLQVRMRVGGEQVFDQTLEIDDYISTLHFGG